MKVYFGASISLGRSLLPVYKKIVKELINQKHTVLSEYVVDPKLKTGAGLTADKLFLRETKTIKKADVMIAEVTAPSWGTAFLMEHALENNIPVLALFYKGDERPLPMMIAGHPELYVEHYDEDNIKTVLNKSLEHFKAQKRRKGKLVVIDGGDGSGKATQTKMLLSYLSKHKISNKYITFPRYKTSFHGKHVGRFLSGEFGGNNQVSPYLSSLAYALDRLTARDEIVQWLDDGNTVVADRYVSASLAHQGSKLDGRKQKEFLDWLYSMEYKEHKLPKEDIVLFLYVPMKKAQILLAKSGGKGQVKGKDIAETDLDHQRKSIDLYKKLSKKFKHWVMISCVNSSGKLLSKQEIHQKILTTLKTKKII
jgi:dTMP kinase